MCPVIKFIFFYHHYFISTYILLINIGIFISIVLFTQDTKSIPNKPYYDNILYFAILSAFIGILFTYLISTYLIYRKFVVTNWDLSFMPGLVGGLLCFIALAKLYKIQWIDSLNLILPYFVIIHIFGRVGCFCAGCCYGKPTSLFFGVNFPLLSLPAKKYGNVAIHPTQLYEAFFLIVLYFLLKKLSSRFRIVVYFILYGLFRFLISFLRGDNHIILFDVVSLNQVWSLLFIIIGIIMYFFIQTTSPETHCSP